MDTASAGRTDWDGEEVNLSFTQKQQESMELCLGMGDKPAESLWVRVSRQTNMGNVVVGGCYIPSDWKEVDEAFFSGQVEEAS